MKDLQGSFLNRCSEFPPQTTEMYYMKVLLILLILTFTNESFAQKLPGNFRCQDLIDHASGQVSRSTDGGKTYFAIPRPNPRDAFGHAMLSYDTYLCQRLSRGELTVDEFNALHAEKAHQVHAERQKGLAERKQLENQDRALKNQEAAIQVQQEAARQQAVQAEITRRQETARHHQQLQQQQIQQQQLEMIRRQQARQLEIQQQQLWQQKQQQQQQRRGLTCFGGGNMIYCN